MSEYVQSKLKKGFDKLFRGKNPMIEGVRWSEKYSNTLETAWIILPKWLANSILTTIIFVLAAGMQGDWIVITVHFLKQIGYFNTSRLSDINRTENNQQNNLIEGAEDVQQNMSWLPFAIGSIFGSYIIYFGLGGFLHWYFYVRQRDNAHEWKCQPEKFLSPEVERHEIILGTCSMMVVSLMGATIAWHSANGGYYTTIYYEFDAYGWPWFFIQFLIVFVHQDYATYWTHRFYHLPFFYKNFHKMHHKYKQPTAFSVTAIHPIEIIHMQLVLFSPVFLYPVHWLPFYSVLLYTYYHAILDHSGITFKAYWWQPWQPDAIFHDNHHQYTHVNFGFNIFHWDKLHGTYRNKYRIYTEDIFYGQGKALDDVTEEERLNDLAERRSENPLAYKGNVHLNALTACDFIIATANADTKYNKSI